MRRLLLIAALCLPWVALAAPTHYAEITIDATSVDEAIPVIPVFLSPGDTTFWNTVLSEDDVVFYDETGVTALDFYRVSFTDNEDGTGTGCFLVNVDGIISASVDATIRAYIGDSSATDQSDGAATFTGTGYSAFYFPGMGLAPVGPALTAVNSPGTTASGIEGVTAATYNGTNQYHKNETGGLVSDWPISLSAIVVSDVDTVTDVIMSIARSSTFASAIGIQTRGNIGGDPVGVYAVGSNGTYASADSASGFTAGTLFQVDGTRDDDTGTSKAYYNGANVGTNATTINAPTSLDWISVGCAAQNGSYTAFFDGNIAQAAVSNVERSANYISTSNTAWTDSGTLLTWGATTALAGDAGETDWLEFTAVTSSTGWTNPTNALTLITGAATDDVPDGTSSAALILTDLDGAASEVTGQTVTGIEFEIAATGEDAGSRELYDDVLRVYDAGAVGDDFGIATQWTDSSTVTRYYGGPGNMLGTSIVDTDVTASTFGITMTFLSDGAEPALMSVYRVRVKIYYNGGGEDLGSFFFR